MGFDMRRRFPPQNLTVQRFQPYTQAWIRRLDFTGIAQPWAYGFARLTLGFFMRRLFAALSLALLATQALAADPAPLAGSKGMVVTAQHLTSDVGADIRRQGGNAVDAAVAVGYALASSILRPAIWAAAGS
jgi:hypothetical protein